MSPSEFKALISLLDDTDPVVESHVKDTLISLGEGVIPKLEEAWESQGDEFVQSRIEDIIYHIQTGQVLDSIHSWKSVGGGSLLRGWYLVSRFHFPELDYLVYKNEVNRLVNRIWLEFRPGMNLPEKLLVINRMLFVQEKFRVNRKSLYDPKNFFLNTLIDTKKGSPISLGLLYLVICQELDLELKGIILPGYFVVTYQDEKNEFFLDLRQKGAFFMRKELNKFLTDMSLDPEDSSLTEPSSHLEILVEWTRTIMHAYRHARDLEKAERFQVLLQALEEE